MSKVVTFEQAKKIKELGFNNLVTSYYYNDGSFYTDIPSDHNTLVRYNNERYSAPTVSQTLDFIRENYQDIAFEITDYLSSEDNLHYVQYEFALYIFSEDDWDDAPDPYDNEYYFDTHHEAESALLNAVLHYLDKGGNHV